MLGGTVAQSLDAASMALQNITGLACDPVANRVEVPCLGKNIMCGFNAVACANMALAGFDKVIPLDETIAAVYDVGLMLPLKESALHSRRPRQDPGLVRHPQHLS